MRTLAFLGILMALAAPAGWLPSPVEGRYSVWRSPARTGPTRMTKLLSKLSSIKLLGTKRASQVRVTNYVTARFGAAPSGITVAQVMQLRHEALQ
jgi:hypothetical protein